MYIVSSSESFSRVSTDSRTILGYSRGTRYFWGALPHDRRRGHRGTSLNVFGSFQLRSNIHRSLLMFLDLYQAAQTGQSNDWMFHEHCAPSAVIYNALIMNQWLLERFFFQTLFLNEPKVNSSKQTLAQVATLFAYFVTEMLVVYACPCYYVRIYNYIIRKTLLNISKYPWNVSIKRSCWLLNRCSYIFHYRCSHFDSLVVRNYIGNKTPSVSL